MARTASPINAKQERFRGALAAYIGKKSGEKPPYFSLGCLSGLCQEGIGNIQGSIGGLNETN